MRAWAAAKGALAKAVSGVVLADRALGWLDGSDWGMAVLSDALTGACFTLSVCCKGHDVNSVGQTMPSVPKGVLGFCGIGRGLGRRLAGLAVTMASGASVALIGGLVTASHAQVPGLNTSSKGAVGAVVTTAQVRAELLAHAPQGVKPGQVVWLGLQLSHQPQWHTYWKNSGDSGMPTQLTWDLPKGWLAGEIAWPTPKKIPIGPLANYGYEGTVLLPAPVTIPAAYRPNSLDRDVAVRLAATWLVCKLECIPEQGQFEIKLPLAGSLATAGSVFEATWAASPKPFKPLADSSLTVQGRTLKWEVAGLPADWQGKPLALYPETPEITSPSAALTQSWVGSVWHGQAVMAAHRGSDPAQLPVVLAQGDGAQAVQLSLPVQGTWPPKDAAPGSVSETPAVATSATTLVSAAASGGVALLLAVLGALVGGLLLNLMPCVFPVLAIKALQLTMPGQTPTSQRMTGLAYTAGVVVSTLALGGLLLGLRAAGQGIGWGFQLQNPVVVMALAALFVLIAMNLLGSLSVGQWAPQGLATAEPKNPVMSALLAGVLAVAVASPCSAPFMGAAMGLALTVPAWQALLIFAALGLGLALPFLALGFMPRLATFLPRPGAWMERFKHFLAFPMLATVVWLVWVLGQQNGIDAAAALLMLLVLLALGAWVVEDWLQKRQQAQLKARHHWVAFATFLLLVAGLAVLGPVALKPAVSAATPNDTAPGAAQSAGVWQEWSPQRQADALAAGQAVFVDYTAAWCVTCQFNKQTTLNRPEVLAAFQAKRVLPLRADWTRPNAVIAQSIAQLGRSAVPVYALHAPGQSPKVLPELLNPSLVQEALAQLP